MERYVRPRVASRWWTCAFASVAGFCTESLKTMMYRSLGLNPGCGEAGAMGSDSCLAPLGALEPSDACDGEMDSAPEPDGAAAALLANPAIAAIAAIAAAMLRAMTNPIRADCRVGFLGFLLGFGAMTSSPFPLRPAACHTSV